VLITKGPKLLTSCPDVFQEIFRSRTDREVSRCKVRGHPGPQRKSLERPGVAVLDRKDVALTSVIHLAALPWHYCSRFEVNCQIRTFGGNSFICRAPAFVKMLVVHSTMTLKKGGMESLPSQRPVDLHTPDRRQHTNFVRSCSSQTATRKQVGTALSERSFQ